MMSYPFLAHGGEEKAADESERATTMPKAHCRGGCKRDFRRDLIFLLDLDRDESNCLRYKLAEGDANRCILVRGCKPVFVLLSTLKSCCISSGVGGAGGPFGSNGRASSRKKL